MVETLIIGVGNQLMGDDGIAQYIIDCLNLGELPQGSRAVFVGTNVWQLVSYTGYKRLIIVDGIITGSPPGTTFFMPARKLKEAAPDQPFYSLHDLTIFDVAGILGLTEKTWLFAVEIDALNTGIGLSPILKDKVELFAAKLQKALLHQGIN